MNLPPIDYPQEVAKISDFIKSTFTKTGKEKAVIALSGGIDSATSFILAHKALGASNLFPLHLPSKKSNPTHTKDVHALLRSVNFSLENLTTIPISAIIQKSWRIIHNYTKIDNGDAQSFFRNRSDLSETQAENMSPAVTASVVAKSDREKNVAQSLPHHLPPHAPFRRAHNAQVAKMNRLRLANLSARIRMMLIFDHAKRYDALVIGTENYSEHLLGYFTRFGDEASDLEPIRHLYKTQVIELAKHLQVPNSIIQKPPSADLWPGQSDENEMGFSYHDADPILYLYDQGKTKEEIVSTGFDAILTEKILATCHQNAFKHLVPYRA